MKIIIRNSKICGKGALATKNVHAGDPILTFGGKIVSKDEINKRIVQGDERLDDPLQVDDNKFLDINDDSIYINHSCDPSTSVVNEQDL